MVGAADPLDALADGVEMVAVAAAVAAAGYQHGHQLLGRAHWPLTVESQVAMSLVPKLAMAATAAAMVAAGAADAVQVAVPQPWSHPPQAVQRRQGG